MTVDTSYTTALLHYAILPKDGARAFQHINADSKTGERVRNWEQEPRTAKIENIRGKEQSFSLDVNGFQFGVHPAKHTSFTEDAAVEREYYPESIDLIKQVTGASRVVLFDHTIRRRRPGEIDDSPQKRQPVAGTHVDQTPASAEARVHRHLPASDAPDLLSKRYQIINLWRPISHPAYDWPLAVCDFQSVDTEKDVVPVALIYPDRQGETYAVQHNEKHKWKYLKGMTPEEFLLIKCFDSKRDVALFTPHTGFEDPATPTDALPRESIELRALVFYD